MENLQTNMHWRDNRIKEISNQDHNNTASLYSKIQKKKDYISSFLPKHKEYSPPTNDTQLNPRKNLDALIASKKKQFAYHNFQDSEELRRSHESFMRSEKKQSHLLNKTVEIDVMKGHTNNIDRSKEVTVLPAYVHNAEFMRTLMGYYGHICKKFPGAKDSSMIRKVVEDHQKSLKDSFLQNQSPKASFIKTEASRFLNDSNLKTQETPERLRPKTRGTATRPKSFFQNNDNILNSENQKVMRPVSQHYKSLSIKTVPSTVNRNFSDSVDLGSAIYPPPILTQEHDSDFMSNYGGLEINTPLLIVKGTPVPKISTPNGKRETNPSRFRLQSSSSSKSVVIPLQRPEQNAKSPCSIINMEDYRYDSVERVSSRPTTAFSISLSGKRAITIQKPNQDSFEKLAERPTTATVGMHKRNMIKSQHNMFRKKPERVFLMEKYLSKCSSTSALPRGKGL